MRRPSPFVAHFTAVALSLTPLGASAVDLRELIFAAIQNGPQTSVVTGPIERTIVSQTRSASPVTATVTPIRNFASPECKRLRVALHQDGVQTTQGTLVRLNLPPFEINMCLNGQPPAETLDSETQRRQAENVQRLLPLIDPPAPKSSQDKQHAR